MPGNRLVGMNGIAVEVPKDWGTNETQPAKCDGESVPVANTVVFPVEGGLFLTPCMLPQGWSSLHVVSLDDSAVAEAIPDYEAAGDIDGVPVFRSHVRPRICGRSCLPNQFNGALILPSENVLMFVNSPQKSIIEDVLGSVRLIPEGYTAVPNLAGLYDDSEVAPIVQEAGLIWENRCPEGADCDIAPIEATDPAAGSVVPVGTPVRAVSADQNAGADVEPTPDELFCDSGSIRVIQYKMVLPDRSETLDDALRPWMEPASGDTKVVMYNTADSAQVTVLNAEGEAYRDVTLIRGSTGGWGVSRVKTCSAEKAPNETPDIASLPAPTGAEMLGTWRAIGIRGRQVAEITFDHDNAWMSWRGYDGCNWVNGRVDLGPNGAFSTHHNSTTLRLCGPPRERKPTAANSVVGASQVRLVNGHLTFYDATDSLLGTFVRATN
ncbi:MAG: META domain-containing protein [Nocardioidaceae bacterium]|nr:META domain-containing protein [Nocardioidaceae bacterium]